GRVRRSMTDLRDEHARLWRKRERYRSHHGANVAQISRQIARVEERMASRIREAVSNERRAGELLQREPEAARGQRYTIQGVCRRHRSATRTSTFLSAGTSAVTATSTHT